MAKMRYLGLTVAVLLVASSCGERMVYEASTDPTIANEEARTTTTLGTPPDDGNDPATSVISTESITWGRVKLRHLPARSSADAWQCHLITTTQVPEPSCFS